jgi:excisionase family DNA binding protein
VRVEFELTDDLLNAIAERATESLRSEYAARWLYGDKAAAEYLGFPVGRVTKLRQAGELPAYRRRQRFSFHTAELDAWVRGSASPLPDGAKGPTVSGTTQTGGHRANGPAPDTGR